MKLLIIKFKRRAIILLTILASVAINPTTIWAGVSPIPTEVGKFNNGDIKIELFGSKNIGERLLEVDLDWKQLDSREQKEFLKSLDQLPKELRRANKQVKKGTRMKLFSKKTLRKIKRYAKSPDRLTQKKLQDLVIEIFQSFATAFPSSQKINIKIESSISERLNSIFQ